MPSSSNSLVIAVRLIAKYRLHVTAMLFYVS